ncbi:hypothetical protein AURDEDRAFT_111308 [Auricularia subglabra TFB-10046 SS5]|nr:hypothetical protein AURDEDRAFT_111308 [Auricularia subglabra TFB-10046 SS5]
MMRPTAAPNNLARWREEQDRLAEQREMEELMRKLELKKLETRKWVLDQARFDYNRPSHERRATALTAPRSVTPGQDPVQRARSRTPTGRRTPGASSQHATAGSNTTGATTTQRPQLTRRATEAAPPVRAARTTTPTPSTHGNPKPRPSVHRSATVAVGSGIPIPIHVERFSPEVREIHRAATGVRYDWGKADDDLKQHEEETRALTESVRRLEAKLGQDDDEDELKEQTRRRLSMELRMARAFASYQDTWAKIAASVPETVSLSFKNIPWPMAMQPASVEDITLPAVSSFVLSPAHSHGKTTKARAREALRAWHPDKWFTTWLSRVRDEDKAAVIQGVNAVARHLSAIANSS